MAWCVRGMKSAECTTGGGGAGADAAPAAAVVWPSVGHDWGVRGGGYIGYPRGRGRLSRLLFSLFVFFRGVV